jgi:segregation and condensation protein B
MSLETQIEALLFVSDQPLSTARLAEVLPTASREDINKAIKTLEKRYADPEVSFHLARIAGGLQLLTKEEHGPLVRQLFRGKRRVRLTKAALETLAIIAYKQPTTRPEIDAIRGVSSGGVLETLMERDLVRIAGRAEGVGRPLLYATTPVFLQYLGLNNLNDLPSLEELEAMIAEREEADRAAEELEMEELAALAEEEPEARRPAATLEERLAEEQLPSLEEIDNELQEQGEQLVEVSNRLAEHAREDDDDDKNGGDDAPRTEESAMVSGPPQDDGSDSETRHPVEERGPA